MNQVCLIIAAILFGIGALLPVIRTPHQEINWLCAGLCMVTIAAILGH